MKNIMKNTMQTVMKSVYAGLMIGISAIVYLSVENKLAGSLLFSFGLLTIVTQGFYLYTGKIGFVKKISELADMFIIIWELCRYITGSTGGEGCGACDQQCTAG